MVLPEIFEHERFSTMLAEAPGEMARRYRAGELDRLNVVRHHDAILDRATGEGLERSTAPLREMFHKRGAASWEA